MPLKGELVVNEAIMDGNWDLVKISVDLPGGSVVKNPLANEVDVGVIPELGRSPGILEYSSILASEILWTEEPGGGGCYSSWGCKELDKTE